MKDAEETFSGGAEGASCIRHGIQQNSQANEPSLDKALESFISPKVKSLGIISQVRRQSNSGGFSAITFFIGVGGGYELYHYY